MRSAPGATAKPPTTTLGVPVLALRHGLLPEPALVNEQDLLVVPAFVDIGDSAMLHEGFERIGAGVDPPAVVALKSIAWRVAGPKVIFVVHSRGCLERVE